MSSNYTPDRHSSAQPFGSPSSSCCPYSSYEPSAPPESGNPNLYPSRNEQVGGGGGGAAAASYVWNNPHLSSTGYCGQQVPQTTGFSGPQSGNPYVQTIPTASRGGAGPIDFLNKLGKQVECIAGNVWGHLKVGNSVSDSALGIISQGSKLLTGGGFVGLYKQIFGLAPNERLLKTYACYLSTSRGPISGTLYITNQKFAFGSDRPIAYAPTPGQQALSYYKVVLPLEKVRGVAPSENPNKPTEKYILVFMDDGHEFWFTGLVNYDKALKNMRESILRRGKNSSNP
ncbi:unnamed protein product [Sphagnum jensenii]|uniref:GRAM domain-containing protein n=1 Tax=Sphagnum jensenii TaxID=128206 RepID=A0ABP0VMU8_9BRYO